MYSKPACSSAFFLHPSHRHTHVSEVLGQNLEVAWTKNAKGLTLSVNQNLNQIKPLNILFTYSHSIITPTPDALTQNWVFIDFGY